MEIRIPRYGARNPNDSTVTHMERKRGTGRHGMGGISNDCEGYIYLSLEDPFPDVDIGLSGGFNLQQEEAEYV